MRRPRTLPVIACTGVLALGLAPASPASAGPSTRTAAAAATVHYAALGDSFAAGEGAPSTLSGFDQASGACHRTSLAWPRLLATAKGLSMTATNALARTTSIAGHVACVGADTQSIVSATTNGETAQATQVAALRPAPDLVTVQVGANDVDLTEVVSQCRFGPSCAATVATARTTARTQLGTRLQAALRAVRTAAPKARVLAVGYPRLYSTASTAPGHCPGLDRSLLIELDGLARDLDASAAAAAKSVGVEYVSTLNVLSGHELCTDVPWVNGVERTIDTTLDVRSAHPTATGQLALATAVRGYLTRYSTAQAANKRPAASFTYRRKAGTTNRVVLDGTRSKDADGSVRTWTWTSGNRVLGSGRVATVSLGRATSLRVTLTVTDNRGARAILTRTVTAGSTRAR